MFGRAWLADLATFAPLRSAGRPPANLVLAHGVPTWRSAQRKTASVHFHGLTAPCHSRQAGGSSKVETVNSSPARFGKNSANFLRTP